mgnify:CR=1 FL=1
MLNQKFCSRTDFDKEKQHFDRKLRQATERSVKAQLELETEREMTKNLMKTRIELDEKVKEQGGEIENLQATIRDLMIHLEAAQSIGTDSVCHS